MHAWLECIGREHLTLLNTSKLSIGWLL